MPAELAGDRVIGWLLGGAAALPHAVEVAQPVEDGVGVDAEIDQAGDLVHADGAEAVGHFQAHVGRAEQAAGAKVALEGVVHNSLHLGLGQVAVFGWGHTAVAPAGEGRAVPASLADEVGRGAQVFQKRPAHPGLHRFQVGTDESVQHQGDVAGAGVASLKPRLPVGNDLLGQLLGGLAEQVRQQVSAHPPGRPERLDATGGGQPQGQVAVDRNGVDADVDVGAGAADGSHRLTAPQPPDGVDAAQHDVTAILEVVRHQGEIVSVPARGERQADAPPRQVVHHRPLFGDADGIVQRQDHAAGADLHALGDGGQGGARQGRVRVEAAERVKVPLRRPHGGEAVLIGEAGAFQE